MWLKSLAQVSVISKLLRNVLGGISSINNIHCELHEQSTNQTFMVKE